jgi:hypothetical protein
MHICTHTYTYALTLTVGAGLSQDLKRLPQDLAQIQGCLRIPPEKGLPQDLT